MSVGGVGMQSAHALDCPDITWPTFANGTGPEFTTPFDVPFTIPDPGLLTGVGGKSLRLEVSSGPLSTNPDPSDDTSYYGAALAYGASPAHGGFTYTPDPTTPFTGDDSFDYWVISACGGDYDDSATATVHVVPTVVGASYSTGFNTTLNVPAGTGFLAHDQGVLADPTDPQSGNIDYDATSAQGGTVTDGNEGDGSFSYTPPPGFTGIDTFGYRVWDIDIDNQYSAMVSIVVGTGPPTNIVAKDGLTDGIHELAQDHSVTVSWTAPAPADTPISSYTVTASPGGATTTVDATHTSAVLTGLTDGIPYTFTVTATDGHGVGPNSGPSNAVVPDDGAPPVVSLAAPAPSITFSTHVPTKWGATDASGILHYDTRRLIIPWNLTTAPWASWLSATRSTSATYGATPGRTYCFDARATDNAGHTSGYSAMRCTTVPLRGDQMSYSSGWTKVTSAAMYSGFAIQSKSHGATMTRTGIVAKRVALVMTRCASCGTIQVRWNGAIVKNYSLAYRSALHEQAVTVLSYPSARKGTLTVTVTSPTGKPVPIEGLAIYND